MDPGLSLIGNFSKVVARASLVIPFVSHLYIRSTALPVLRFPTNITKTQMNSPRHLFNSEVFRGIPS